MGVPETLFVTMRARAMETIRSDAAIKDPDAVKMLERIKFDESPKNKVSKASQAGIIIRTVILDNVVAEYVSKNPQGTVVNIALNNEYIAFIIY